MKVSYSVTVELDNTERQAVVKVLALARIDLPLPEAAAEVAAELERVLDALPAGVAE